MKIENFEKKEREKHRMECELEREQIKIVKLTMLIATCMIYRARIKQGTKKEHVK